MNIQPDDNYNNLNSFGANNESNDLLDAWE